MYFNKLKISLLLLLWSITFISLNAQKYRAGLFDMGIALGAANYSGDLSQKHPNYAQTSIMVGLYGRYSLSPYFQWRNQLSFGHIAANDAKSQNYQYRNLNFKTNIYEFASTFEFNFVKYGINRSSREFDFTSYVFAGVGVFYFNPIGHYNNQDIHLRDLQTENKKYSLLQPAIPYGMGIKFAKTKRFEMGFEIGMRRLFTDYLDDVSGNYPNFNQLEADRGLASAQTSHAQTYNGNLPSDQGRMRGDNHLTDYYVFTNITLTYRIVKRDACP